MKEIAMYTPAEMKTIMRASKILETKAKYNSEVISSPDQVKLLMRTRFAHLEREVFLCMFLNAQHQLIEAQEMFQGTIDASSVYPREVVKEALRLNAASVIFGHNHPSGMAEPSTADQRITIRLRDALALVDIRVLDHVVVGRGTNTTVSMAERGLL
jgi:DNA repair protein RadC